MPAAAIAKDFKAFIDGHIATGVALVEPFNDPGDDYRLTPIESPCAVFCAPPKADHASRQSIDFNHREFWTWCNNLVAAGNIVFVAETSAPPDWVPVFTRDGKNKKALEKLFYRAQTYDEQAAFEYYHPPIHKMFTIKQALRFVHSAAKNADRHIVIEDQRVTASTPITTISAPIDISVNVKPNAKLLDAAIKVAARVDSPVSTVVQDDGRLLLTSGKFKTYIPCVDELLQTPIVPKGNYAENVGEVFEAIRKVAPFLTTNQLRPWANSVLITANTCLATNNVVFCESWHGSNLPFQFALSAEVVAELLAIGETPIAVQVWENTATFWFTGERYFASVLIDDEWPVKRIYEHFDKPNEQRPIDEDFFNNVKLLKPFATDRELVYLDQVGIRTHAETTDGTLLECETGATKTICCKVHHMLSIEGVAKKIDWSTYPDAMPFTGAKLRGLLLGCKP